MNISFVYPSFLFALSLLAIPVIVHLFDFRRFRKILFTNVGFLKELKEETTSSSRLKHLLVLLSRLLAVFFLVLAFSQPYIPAAGGAKLAASRVVSIYIDNSFSMDAVSREGTLLDVARTKAAEIASGFRPSDKFQLVTNNFDAAHQRLISREEFLSMLQDIKPAPYSRKISEILKRQKELLHTGISDERMGFLISDFQEKMVDPEQITADTTVDTYLLPLEAESVSNAFVDSVWLLSPVVKTGEPCQFMARIRNAGELDLESVPVSLFIDDVRRSVATATIPAGAYADIPLAFTPDKSGWLKGQVVISDNPITFDDTYYISLEVAEQLHVLCIRDKSENRYLKALFGEDPFFSYTDIGMYNIDYAQLQYQDLVVLSELPEYSSGLLSALKSYVDNGGSLVLIPDSVSGPVPPNTLLTELGLGTLSAMTESDEKTISLALEDPLFEGVFSETARQGQETDLPSVKRYYPENSVSSGAREVLMKLRSGASLLSRSSAGKGNVYVFAVPLSGTSTNLARHAVFVPVMYRIALLSRHHGPLAFRIGTDDQVTVSDVKLSGEPVFHLVKPGTGFDIIPSYRMFGNSVSIGMAGQVEEAGNYDLMLDNNKLAIVSYNYNRDESVMKFYSGDQLSSMAEVKHLNKIKTFDAGMAGIAASVTTMTSGIPLWKYCVILALVFLSVEVLLLKFMKG
ncbi:MAG TPA: BatA domain-containing protein [Bacteroidia bacterium]|nr:BatA domain-containing protein [Bacteroidia bacterium]